MAVRAHSLTPPDYFDIARQHLEIIDGDTPVHIVRLHCHFALLFLQLAHERGAETDERTLPCG